MQGLLVLDLTRHLPGPLAVRLLRDLGARTIKVEEPRSGDPVREAPPFLDGESALARHLLAGAESIAVDLRREEGVELVRRLALACDVVVESSRPGALARLGLDLSALRAEKPSLVVCSISGWGASGGLASRSGHDLTYQAAAGLVDERVPRTQLADVAGAWAAVGAILAAVVRVARGGEGASIDLGLADVAAHANLVAWGEIAATGGTVGVLAGRFPCYRTYRCADRRWLALGALERPFWKSFCRVVGVEDLVALQYDPSAAAHREVEAVLARRGARAWQEELVAADVPAEVVATPEEALAHPWLRSRALVAPDGSSIAFPALFDGLRLGASGSVPPLGGAGPALLEELIEPADRRRLGRAAGARRSIVGRLRSWWLRRRAARL